MILVCDKTEKIIKNKAKLERLLKVKITIKGDEITVEGKPEDEYIAEKVISALSFGFPLPAALLIKEEDFLFEILDIKDYTRRKDMEAIRARIIGTGGKTLKTLSTLTECYFELKDNSVGIIGSAELIKNAQDAIIFIIQGSKQANVYAFLEKHHAQPIMDWGLKEKKGKKPKKSSRKKVKE
jgi:KH domain-containing protein